MPFLVHNQVFILLLVNLEQLTHTHEVMKMTFDKEQFAGKVVVVTGAGGGIGRAHALGFAQAGAKVVVNDLGVARDGEGVSQKAADTVVDEIKQLGGEAVANYDNVADTAGAEGIAKAAMDAFGRIDVLVNNAGILRDKTFMKMTDDMWDIVIQVHLRGTYSVTKAIAPIMQEQGSGRIINTTSLAGLLGNFGQTNYSAAKAGIYGFTRTLALEMQRHGVTVNAIAPIAKTRMTEDIEAVPEDNRPEQVTPMVMYLASKEAEDVTGRVFGIHGNHLFEYYMDQTGGVEHGPDKPWTPVTIHEEFKTITQREEKAASGGGNIDAVLPKLNEVLKELGVQVVPAGMVPAGAATKKEVTLEDMFQLFPSVFLPDKAGDFEGLIQFLIDGAEPEAIYVKGGKVEVKTEVGESPAVKITTDRDSMLSMMEGKADPTKLFMKGKIKADKMPVLMKFDKMFAIPELPAKVQALMAEAQAGGGEEGGEMTISDAFQLFKDVFKPEKAGDWSGVIQFIIDGDEPQALHVKDGSVEVKSEKADSPACTITTDRDSMLQMLHGEADPTKLYMKGKIKADKMPIMMKFNTMFAIKELPALIDARQAGAKPAAAAGPQDLTSMFAMLPEVFVPEAAEGFTGTYQFLINGDKPQQVTIADGKVEVRQSEVEKPDVLVRTDKETIEGLLRGEVDATKAVMKGKIKASRTDRLLKFKKMFDLKELANRIKSGSVSVPDGLNRDYIGQWFLGTAQHVKPDHAKAYAKATNDDNPLYFKEDPKELVIPPVFPVSLAINLLEQVATEDDLNMDLGRMVHAEHEIRYLRPLKAWDLVYSTAQVTSMEQKSSGETMTVTIHGKVDGEDVLQMDAVLFVRGESRGKKSSAKKEEKKPKGEPVIVHTMKVTPDQSKRYAEASGDDNPIHLDPEMAKSVGLPDIILHGLCTMAFSSQAIVKQLDIHPHKLTTLKVRFSKPVFMGDELTTKGWVEKEEEGRKHIVFEVENQRGELVLTQGRAVVEK